MPVSTSPFVHVRLEDRVHVVQLFIVDETAQKQHFNAYDDAKQPMNQRAGARPDQARRLGMKAAPDGAHGERQRVEHAEEQQEGQDVVVDEQCVQDAERVPDRDQGRRGVHGDVRLLSFGWQQTLKLSR